MNLNSIFYSMRTQIPAILATGKKAIINIASILNSMGFANTNAYIAAKHRMIGLTKTTAIEYTTQSIHINSVKPAFIATPLLTKNLSDKMLASLTKMHPVGRIGTSEEISTLTCFLLSDRASFITGSYHLIDRAYTAQ